MAKLTEAQYKIIADRMIEEQRKYGDRLRPGHWADVAARKVVSHIEEFRKGERVFTESEVKAMLEDVARCMTWPMAKQVLKEKHGFDLVSNE